MPDPILAAPTSPFTSILSWSAAWPDWQQDALRRIVGSGQLKTDHLKELAAICRAKHGLLPTTVTAPTAVPLADVHIPGGADGTVSVSLFKLSGLQNIGRLLNDQELVFGKAPGLTLIYGENGAGKSGYARVIKKACRARGTPQDIKPDAFAAAATGPAMATITFRAGAAELPFDWRDGVASDARLGNIFVFDSFSAQVYVKEDGPACFKPRGMDVLPELVKACDAIKGELQKEIDAAYAENTKTAMGWKYSASTTVGNVINALHSDTKPETIDAAVVFTDADERRLREIIATLNDDPKKKSADSTATANRIRTFAENAKSRATSVDDTAMLQLADALKEAETFAKAATAAAGPEFKNGELPWGDNDVWRELWKAAQKYSEQVAYKGKPFPVTEADAKCLLCQQPLQAEAIDRYARFNKFVADETRRRADAAKAKIADLKKGVDPLRAIGTEAVKIEADLEREAAGTFAAIKTYAMAIDARITHAQKSLKNLVWTDTPVLPASPCADLVTLADRLDKRAKEEEAAADPKKKQQLEKERDELTDKKWLKDKAAEIKAQITRLAHIAKLKKCQEDCASRPVSDKAKELDKQFVTDAFCKAFEQERDALGLTTLSVSLSAVRVTKAEGQFAVVVDGAPNANVEDIASEGEHRCIALAAFMAELSQASHKSALVFDDPVSSLDYKHCKALAARLVKEAAQRQVVVFTHDLEFVCDLESAARGASLHIHRQHIEWFAGKPGLVLPNLVWDAMSTDEQMKELRERIGVADKLNREAGESEYRKEVNAVVDDMRAACERIIEDVLFGDVLKRHSSQIKVGNLDKVAVVQASHWLEVKRIWSECSDATPGHANATSGPHRAPSPDKLKEWMKVLDDTVEAVKNARKFRTGLVTTEAKTASIPAPRV